MNLALLLYIVYTINIFKGLSICPHNVHHHILSVKSTQTTTTKICTNEWRIKPCQRKNHQRTKAVHEFEI